MPEPPTKKPKRNDEGKVAARRQTSYIHIILEKPNAEGRRSEFLFVATASHGQKWLLLLLLQYQQHGYKNPALAFRYLKSMLRYLFQSTGKAPLKKLVQDYSRLVHGYKMEASKFIHFLIHGGQQSSLEEAAQGSYMALLRIFRQNVRPAVIPFETVKPTRQGLQKLLRLCLRPDFNEKATTGDGLWALVCSWNPLIFWAPARQVSRIPPTEKALQRDLSLFDGVTNNPKKYLESLLPQGVKELIVKENVKLTFQNMLDTGTKLLAPTAKSVIKVKA